jgi:hypothetical protein
MGVVEPQNLRRRPAIPAGCPRRWLRFPRRCLLQKSKVEGERLPYRPRIRNHRHHLVLPFPFQSLNPSLTMWEVVVRRPLRRRTANFPDRYARPIHRLRLALRVAAARRLIHRMRAMSLVRGHSRPPAPMEVAVRRRILRRIETRHGQRHHLLLHLHPEGRAGAELLWMEYLKTRNLK